MSAECHTCGTDLHYDGTCPRCEQRKRADHWIRLFNRLEAAVSRHRSSKEGTGFCDDADDALHAAHRKVLKAAFEGEGERP